MTADTSLVTIFETKKNGRTWAFVVPKQDPRSFNLDPETMPKKSPPADTGAGWPAIVPPRMR